MTSTSKTDKRRSQRKRKYINGVNHKEEKVYQLVESNGENQKGAEVYQWLKSKGKRIGLTASAWVSSALSSLFTMFILMVFKVVFGIFREAPRREKPIR